MPHDTDYEMLDYVTDSDHVAGRATRAEIHARDLLHRAVHVCLFDRAGRLLLQKRSARKDRFPGYWDIAVGGHVDAGEGYSESAVRECREELGLVLSANRLTAVGKLAACPETGFEFIAVYAATLVSPANPNAEEIDALRWVDPAEYLERADPGSDDPDWRVSPAGQASIRLVLENARDLRLDEV
jgi:isopentenyl-diphosphate delta-isomerase type 1